jgi:tetrahydromethanopterin S-methyltransferase subunit B
MQESSFYGLLQFIVFVFGIVIGLIILMVLALTDKNDK